MSDGVEGDKGREGQRPSVSGGVEGGRGWGGRRGRGRGPVWVMGWRGGGQGRGGRGRGPMWAEALCGHRPCVGKQG